MREVLGSKRLKILLVEDNPNDAQLLMETLRTEIGHEIETDWVQTLKTAMAMRRVITNLVSNALKFAPGHMK
jgi:signal transduction histidine kinase